MPTPVIIVWRWEDAPDNYRALSTHGGDEDWVAFVPKALVGSYIPWLEEGSAFGRCTVSVHRMNDGAEVRIGTHA